MKKVLLIPNEHKDKGFICARGIAERILSLGNSVYVPTEYAHAFSDISKVGTGSEAELFEKMHLRTLERIFIEERIYKAIEEMKTESAVNKAVKPSLNAISTSYFFVNIFFLSFFITFSICPVFISKINFIFL